MFIINVVENENADCQSDGPPVDPRVVFRVVENGVEYGASIELADEAHFFFEQLAVEGKCGLLLHRIEIDGAFADGLDATIIVATHVGNVDALVSGQFLLLERGFEFRSAVGADGDAIHTAVADVRDLQFSLDDFNFGIANRVVLETVELNKFGHKKRFGYRKKFAFDDGVPGEVCLSVSWPPFPHRCITNIALDLDTLCQAKGVFEIK